MIKKSLFRKIVTPIVVATFFFPSNINIHAYSQKRFNFTESAHYSQPVNPTQNVNLEKVEMGNALERIVENNSQNQISKKEEKILKYIDQVHTEVQEEEELPEYLSPKYISIIAKKESSYNPRAESPVGAKGLMQIMDPTWEEMGGKRGQYFNPKENLRVGTKYLNQIASFCEKNHPSWDFLSPKQKIEIISAAYNAGQTYLMKKNWNIKKMPRETKSFVRYITAQMREEL